MSEAAHSALCFILLQMKYKSSALVAPEAICCCWSSAPVRDAALSAWCLWPALEIVCLCLLVHTARELSMLCLLCRFARA
jgi:hypothetical protein